MKDGIGAGGREQAREMGAKEQEPFLAPCHDAWGYPKLSACQNTRDKVQNHHTIDPPTITPNGNTVIIHTYTRSSELIVPVN